MEKMTPKEIIDTAMQQCGDQQLKFDFITLANCYVGLSLLHSEIYSEIVELSNDIDLVTTEIDLVSGTDEYTLASADASTTTFGVGKPRRILLKLESTLDEYKEAEIVNYYDLDRDEVYYSENQSVYSPLVMIKGKVLKIFPTPGEAVTGGLKVIANQEPYKILEAEAANAGVFLIPGEYQKLLIAGLKPWIYGARGRDYANDAAQYRQEYETLLQDQLTEMLRKDNEIIQGTVPDLSSLE